MKETESEKGLEILQEMASDILMRFEDGKNTPEETEAAEAYLQEYDPIYFDERLILADLRREEREVQWFPLLPLDELEESMEMNQEFDQVVAVCRWEDDNLTFGIQIDRGVPFLIYQTYDYNAWLACCGYSFVSIDRITWQVVYHSGHTTKKLGWAQIAIQGEAGDRPAPSVYGFQIPLALTQLREAQYLALAVPTQFEMGGPIQLSHPWMSSEQTRENQDSVKAGARGSGPQVICAERDDALGISYRLETQSGKLHLIVRCDKQGLLNKPCVLHFYWKNEGPAQDYYWNTEHTFRLLGEETEFSLPGDANTRVHPHGRPLFNCDLI